MQYWELPDQAKALRAQAIKLMDANEIASTPVNYELCFHRESGQNGELQQELDAAIADGRARSGDYTKQLRDRFFSRTGDLAVGDSASGLGFELKQLSAALETAGKGSSAYGRTLGIAAQQLANADASPQLRNMIDAVASATRLTIQNNRELEARVEASAGEVETLRNKLETVRKEARVDVLTGLANRRCFDETFVAAIEESRVEGTPLCVLMCDIDHFKRFNDTWGHATGDQVLRLVAGCVSSNVKGRDTAARYGGEELVVVLPKTALADAMVVAEQIRRSVESRKIVKKSTGESYGSITLSIGGSELKPGESPTEFLARADACLYAAKHAGRNRVCSEVPTGLDKPVEPSKAQGTKEHSDSLLELQFNYQHTKF